LIRLPYRHSFDNFPQAVHNKEMVQPSIDPAPIQKAELFSTLLKKEIDFVVSRSGVVQLRRGGRLFSAGERAAHFYMLTKGLIRVFKSKGDNCEDELARFTPGDAIGDFDFVRGAEYDACAEAAEDSELIMFPGYGLSMDSFADEEPHTLCRILLNSIVMMTGRIKSTNKLIVENMSWVQELHRRAYEDPGTGLWKQAFLTDEINRILEDPTALILLKPDRFKVLVDSRGHGAGDEAMVRIAMVLKNISRKVGRGWPLRFKSNETGILINKCSPAQAEKIAADLGRAITALEPVPAENGIPAFPFTGTVAWSVWPADDSTWDNLFQHTYDLLMDTWKADGNKIVRYRKGGEK
jgi:diguanylate cyclase (GGDEF)-like protein